MPRVWPEVGMFFCLGLVAGCFDPDLGAGAPFTCPDGSCPRGYRCAQQLCIAAGEPDPPLRLASTAQDSAAPQPVWDGSQFAVFWQQNDPLAIDPGLHLTVLLDPPLTATLTSLTGDVLFTGLFHADTQRYVVGVAQNDDRGNARLRVLSQPLGGGDVETALDCSAGPSPLGYSTPSLGRGVRGDVIVSYTFGQPPLLRDNLYWLRLPLGSGAAAGDCNDARAVNTANRYANEVVGVDTPLALLLFWRDLDVHITPIVGTNQGITTDLPFLHVASAVVNSGKIGIAAQASRGTQSEPPWLISLSDFASGTSGRTEQPLASPGLMPDVVSDGQRFITCSRDPSGELVLGRYRSDTLAANGAPVVVKRLSRAEIASCRLAAAGAATNQVAVAWSERIPPSTMAQYVTQVTLSP